MNAPTSAQRSSRSLMGRVMPGSLQERFHGRLARLVATRDLRLQRVDRGEQRAALAGDLGLEGGQLLHEVGQVRIAALAEVGEAVRPGDGVQRLGVERLE